MNPKKLSYALDVVVVNTLLKVLDKTQVSGFQNAENLLAVKELLQNPLNAEEIEKDTLAELQAKYESKKENEKKVPTEK